MMVIEMVATGLTCWIVFFFCECLLPVALLSWCLGCVALSLLLLRGHGKFIFPLFFASRWGLCLSLGRMVQLGAWCKFCLPNLSVRVRVSFEFGCLSLFVCLQTPERKERGTKKVMEDGKIVLCLTSGAELEYFHPGKRGLACFWAGGESCLFLVSLMYVRVSHILSFCHFVSKCCTILVLFLFV